VPNALERILHVVLFYFKLRFVGDVPEGAAAALQKHRAVRLDSVRRGGEQLVQPREGVIAFNLHDVGDDLVPSGGVRHKNCAAVIMPHTAAFHGDSSNGKRNFFIFCKCSDNFILRRCRNISVSYFYQFLNEQFNNPEFTGICDMKTDCIPFGKLFCG